MTINPYRLESYEKHIIGVAQIAEKIARELRVEEPRRLYAAGLFHDVGKMITDDIYNETHIGASFLKRLGFLEMGHIIKSHFTTAELIDIQLEEDAKHFNERFPGVVSHNYLPKDLDQKILAYADLHFSDKHITFHRRLHELKERHLDDSMFLKGMDRAYGRLYALCQEIDNLRRMRE